MICDAAAMADDEHYGTEAPDAPVKRADFERALRFLNMSDLDVRDSLLRLAAHVVALTDELTRRLDGVEPLPAEPNTPARPASGTIEDAVGEQLTPTFLKIQLSEVNNPGRRVWLESDPQSKYDVAAADVPCAELIHLCGARCCTYSFPLSTADLDEGVIRWDYGRPYMIRQRASDHRCVHNDPSTKGCTVHAQRPIVCRKYDCRNDVRVWIDYEKRIPAPLDTKDSSSTEIDLFERLRRREMSYVSENDAVTHMWPESEPRTGPQPAAPRTRMLPRRD